jgi:hypothetical protein
MIYELDKETIDFICKHKITLNQFAICLLIHKKDVATILRINEEIGVVGDCMIPTGVKDGKTQYKKEIVDLINRGFILNNFLDKKDPYALDNFIVTAKFTEGFLDDEVDMFTEFWELYPKSLHISGIDYPAKSTDFDDLKIKYLKAIKGSKKKHKEIISKINRHKETNAYAVMGIEKFVGSRHWENIEDNGGKPSIRVY